MRGAKTAVDNSAARNMSNPASSESASEAVRIVMGILMIIPQEKKNSNSVVFGLCMGITHCSDFTSRPPRGSGRLGYREKKVKAFE